MWGANLSGTFNALRVIYKPQLCMPQLVIPDFSKLPIPLCFNKNRIKAVVLDKDNTFAKPYDDKVYAGYKVGWDRLRQCYPGAKLLIVSNTAGTTDDKDYKQAERIEKTIGVSVLRHSTKKPGCHKEVMEFFRENGICDSPKEVVVVGDRLFTDVIMANMGHMASGYVMALYRITSWSPRWRSIIIADFLTKGISHWTHQKMGERFQII